jgi:diketogulonate reductase-like aldo/keto reductase
MKNNLEARMTLANGVEMPLLGLGVLHIPDGSDVEDAVTCALEEGYRSIDTASIYKNEDGVGAALLKTDIPRSEIFLTTKLWNRDQGYESTLKAFEASLERLKTDYVDLYLVHWPGPEPSRNWETWRALEAIYTAGQARAIGVSNFLTHHLETLTDETVISPMVNQIEFHPQLQQPELIQYCRDHDICVEAWRPIMKGEVNNIELLQKMGAKYGKTPVQITLRWIIQQDIVAIPKSQNPERIRENAHIFDFALDDGELEQISELDLGRRLGPDPDTFDLDF